MQQQERATAPSNLITTAADSLSAIIEGELAVHSCHDYLDAAHFEARNYSHDETNGGDVNEAMSPGDRTAMVDWCYDIVDKCRFARETVAVAVNMVDRFMSSLSSSSGNPQDDQGCLSQDAEATLCDRRQYQLASLTALYMSIKLNEHAAFSCQDFSAASRGIYSAEEIEHKEREMLHALEWRLCPTALQVGCQILDLMKERMAEGQGTLHFVREELYFQTEIAVREYYFATRRPSTVAVASLLNAIEEVNVTDCILLMNALIFTLQEFEFEEPDVILDVRDKLKALLDKNEGGSDGDIDASIFEEDATGVV